MAYQRNQEWVDIVYVPYGIRIMMIWPTLYIKRVRLQTWRCYTNKSLYAPVENIMVPRDKPVSFDISPSD